jgi:hypothetical protein
MCTVMVPPGGNPIAVNRYINNHYLFNDIRTKYSVFGGQNVGIFKFKLMIVKVTAGY